MPTEINRYRCDACGRHFNSPEALKIHSAECAAAKATGSGSRATDRGDLEEGDDRDWVSTP